MVFKIRSMLLAFVLAACSLDVVAVVDIYQFDTESQQARYHQLAEELRCPKCQNQNLAGSDSQIAEDLRRELHRLLIEGKTDKEIKTFMVDRYGEFVLYKPRLQSSTLVLWGLPIVLLIGGLVVVICVVRRRGDHVNAETTDETGASLSDSEQSQLKHLLDQDMTQQQADKETRL